MTAPVVRLRAGVSIREFKQRLQKLPISVAHAIAAQAAPLLTAYAQAAHARRENVYGDPYPPRADGDGQIDLVFSGDTRDTLRFVVDGTLIRASLGPRYAKYLIGKYKILPIGDRTAMPANWARALDELARTVVERPTLVAA